MAKRKNTNNTNNNNNTGNNAMQEITVEMLLAKIAELENAEKRSEAKQAKQAKQASKQASKRSKKRQVREENAQTRSIATLQECIENELKIPWKAILIDFISENEGLTTGEITQALQIPEFSTEAGKDLSAPMRGSIYNLSTDRYGSTFEKRGTPAKWYIYDENAGKVRKGEKTTSTPKPPKPTKPTKPTKTTTKPTIEELLEMLKSHI